jgi:hypothetical protein
MRAAVGQHENVASRKVTGRARMTLKHRRSADDDVIGHLPRLGVIGVGADNSQCSSRRDCKFTSNPSICDRLRKCCYDHWGSAASTRRCLYVTAKCRARSRQFDSAPNRVDIAMQYFDTTTPLK